MPLFPRIDALRRLIRTLLVGGSCVLLLPGLRAAEAMRRAFDLPAGRADLALKLLSQQAGVQLVFDSRLVENVSVHAVRGDFTPLEAAQRLLAGTALRARRDERSGILSIERDNPAPTPRKSPGAR